MDMQVDSNNELATIALVGRFDAHEVGAFRGALDDLLAQGIAHFHVDLSGVVFVDSTGLAAMVRGMKRCRERGGDFVIVSPSDPVRVILELTCLDVAFTISDGSDAADKVGR